MNSSDLEILRTWITESNNIVFFGGAGVSTESGIPDFRSVDGLYHQKFDYPPETILSHHFFYAHTDYFYRFYREKLLAPDVEPNAAHKTLARWEREGKLRAVVTQNIDGLHQAAGSRRVFELHGSVHRNFCLRCGRRYDAAFVAQGAGLPRCACGGLVRPDVVLYGEALDEDTVRGALNALMRADLLIVGGTSLAVYPAAAYLDAFRGDALVVINRDPTPRDGAAALLLREPIGQALGSLQIEG